MKTWNEDSADEDTLYEKKSLLKPKEQSSNNNHKSKSSLYNSHSSICFDMFIFLFLLFLNIFTGICFSFLGLTLACFEKAAHIRFDLLGLLFTARGVGQATGLVLSHMPSDEGHSASAPLGQQIFSPLLSGGLGMLSLAHLFIPWIHQLWLLLPCLVLQGAAFIMIQYSSRKVLTLLARSKRKSPRTFTKFLSLATAFGMCCGPFFYGVMMSDPHSSNNMSTLTHLQPLNSSVTSILMSPSTTSLPIVQPILMEEHHREKRSQKPKVSDTKHLPNGDQYPADGTKLNKLKMDLHKNLEKVILKKVPPPVVNVATTGATTPVVNMSLLTVGGNNLSEYTTQVYSTFAPVIYSVNSSEVSDDTQERSEEDSAVPSESENIKQSNSEDANEVPITVTTTTTTVSTSTSSSSTLSSTLSTSSTIPPDQDKIILSTDETNSSIMFQTHSSTSSSMSTVSTVPPQLVTKPVYLSYVLKVLDDVQKFSFGNIEFLSPLQEIYLSLAVCSLLFFLCVALSCFIRLFMCCCLGERWTTAAISPIHTQLRHEFSNSLHATNHLTNDNEIHQLNHVNKICSANRLTSTGWLLFYRGLCCLHAFLTASLEVSLGGFLFYFMTKHLAWSKLHASLLLCVFYMWYLFGLLPCGIHDIYGCRRTKDQSQKKHLLRKGLRLLDSSINIILGVVGVICFALGSWLIEQTPPGHNKHSSSSSLVLWISMILLGLNLAYHRRQCIANMEINSVVIGKTDGAEAIHGEEVAECIGHLTCPTILVYSYHVFLAPRLFPNACILLGCLLAAVSVVQLCWLYSCNTFQGTSNGLPQVEKFLLRKKQTKDNDLSPRKSSSRNDFPPADDSGDSDVH